MAESEQLDVGVQNQEPALSASETVNSAKKYSDDEVNKIIGRKKKEAYERGRMDAVTEYQNREPQPQVAPQAQQSQPVQNQMGGMAQFTPDQLQKMISDGIAQHSQSLQNQQLQRAAQEIEKQFWSKVQAGKEKYPDWDQKAGPILNSIGSIPEIAMLANGMDNTADIIYDISNNLHKIGNLRALHTADPNLAHAEMMRLSNSLKSNEAAKNAPIANEPLSQIKPSTAGADNGELTIDDLRSKPWMKV